MNCKQGDIAVVIRSNGKRESVGRIVRCVKLMPGHLYTLGGK